MLDDWVGLSDPGHGTREFKPPSGDYAIGQEELASMSRDHDVSALQQYGGASDRHDNYALIGRFILYLILRIMRFPCCTSG